MSTVDIVVLALAAVAIIGGALFALRLGTKGSSGPKTGGQTDGTPIPTDNERQSSLDKQKKPAAE